MKFYINIREEIVSLANKMNEINHRNGTEYFNDHIYNKLVKFDKTVELLNSYNIVLSDEDFKRIMYLDSININIDWIVKYIYIYKTNLTDALIGYIAIFKR